MIEIIGHRGARGEAPENTLAGFKLAADMGIKHIELDVHLSADHHLVVIHDSKVDRTTWQQGRVTSFQRHELALLDARRNTPGWHSATGVPALKDVVELCPDDTFFEFEVKVGRSTRTTLLAHSLKQFINEHTLKNRVVVTSSSIRFLRLMKSVDSDIETGYVCSRRYLQPTRVAKNLGCSWVILHYSLINASMMRRVSKRGLKLAVWTVNDLTEADRLVNAGVTHIITDYPSAFMAHFQTRNHNRSPNPTPPETV